MVSTLTTLKSTINRRKKFLWCAKILSFASTYHPLKSNYASYAVKNYFIFAESRFNESLHLLQAAAAAMKSFVDVPFTLAFYWFGMVSYINIMDVVQFDYLAYRYLFKLVFNYLLMFISMSDWSNLMFNHISMCSCTSLLSN